MCDECYDCDALCDPCSVCIYCGGCSHLAYDTDYGFGVYDEYDDYGEHGDGYDDYNEPEHGQTIVIVDLIIGVCQIWFLLNLLMITVIQWMFDYVVSK